MFGSYTSSPACREIVRRDKIWKRIGRPYDCLRLMEERKADERQRFRRERGAEDMRPLDGGRRGNTVY